MLFFSCQITESPKLYKHLLAKKVFFKVLLDILYGLYAFVATKKVFQMIYEDIFKFLINI